MKTWKPTRKQREEVEFLASDAKFCVRSTTRRELIKWAFYASRSATRLLMSLAEEKKP